MQRGDAAAGACQFGQAVTQRRLQRPYVEDQSLRLQDGQLRQNPAGHGERRGDDDYVEVDARVGPVRETPGPVFDAGVCDRRGESLRREELGEPAAHLAAAADHEHAAAVALALGDDPVSFLAGERRPDELRQNYLREIRIDAQFPGLRAGHVEHVLLPRIVAGRRARRQLVSSNLADDALPFGDQFDDLPIDVREFPAQVVEVHRFLRFDTLSRNCSFTVLPRRGASRITLSAAVQSCEYHEPRITIRTRSPKHENTCRSRLGGR